MMPTANRHVFVVSAVVALACAASCGGSVITGGSGSGGNGTTGAGAGATGSGAGTTTAPSGWPRPRSPAAAPCAGFPAGLRCTYGDSVQPECRDVMTCLNGQWLADKTGATCAPPAPGACPGGPAAGQVCGTQGLVCTYADTFCLCDECAGGPCMAPPTTWQCASPPATAGCPAAVPNDGTPCGAEALMCTYGFPCTPTGAVVGCAGGAWKWNTMIACGGLRVGEALPSFIAARG